MKIIIVSGFLGAGKTTFIKELIKVNRSKFAIIENDYADAGIDVNILKKDESDIWEVSEGCICCSNAKDFASNILTIANSIDPEYLIVEPTGIGYLSSVIETIKKVCYERISLMQPLVIVDAHSLLINYEKFKTLYEDQIQNSNQIILSKLDILNQEEINKAKDLILNINSKAILCADSYLNKSEEWWKQLINTKINGEVIGLNNDKLKMDTVSINSFRFDRLGSLIKFLERLIRNEFGDIYRSKGFAKVGGETVIFNVVDKRYSIEESEPHKAKAIFIGLDINRNKLNTLFKNKDKQINYKSIEK